MLRSRSSSGPFLHPRRLHGPARLPLLLASAVVLTTLAISATPALAATPVNLYAVPSGGGGTGNCQSGAPACSLAYAVGLASGAALKPVHETLLATVTAGKATTRTIKIT
jgi:hypothetical protein